MSREVESFPRRPRGRRLRCHLSVGALLLTACAGPATTPSEAPARAVSAPTGASNRGDQPLPGVMRVFAEALAIIQNQYVEVTQTRPLIVHALRGIERRLGSRGISVDVAEQAVTIVHRDSGAPAETLALPLADVATLEEGLRVVARASTFVQGRSGVGLDEIRDALIQGLMVVDPQGDYLDRRSYREMQVETSGEFAAAGLEITLRNGTLTVVAPIDGTPAFRAGLQPGDRIVKMDGLSTKDVPLADAVKRMRGRPGSQVTFTVERDRWTEPKDIEITREQIRVHSVRSQDLGDGIVSVKLRQFQEQTPHDLERVLAELGKAAMKGLILDLRGNPGGLLTAAVEVSEMFLDNGRLVVYTEGRVRNQNMRFSSRARKAYTAVPMVVLVNQGSSAASEIVAGALQDWGRAPLVGNRTFGRASIQTIIRLSDASGLRLTTAKWFTPKGRSVQGSGLTPDLAVEAREAAPITPGTTADEVLAGNIQLASGLAKLRSLIVPRGR